MDAVVATALDFYTSPKGMDVSRKTSLFTMTRLFLYTFVIDKRPGVYFTPDIQAWTQFRSNDYDNSSAFQFVKLYMEEVIGTRAWSEGMKHTTEQEQKNVLHKT
jgi:hypothetical protein